MLPEALLLLVALIALSVIRPLIHTISSTSFHSHSSSRSGCCRHCRRNSPRTPSCRRLGLRERRARGPVCRCDATSRRDGKRPPESADARRPRSSPILHLTPSTTASEWCRPGPASATTGSCTACMSIGSKAATISGFVTCSPKGRPRSSFQVIGQTGCRQPTTSSFAVDMFRSPMTSGARRSVATRRRDRSHRSRRAVSYCDAGRTKRPGGSVQEAVRRDAAYLEDPPLRSGSRGGWTGL